MSKYWKSYEGLLFRDVYPLHSCLSEEGSTATFRTEYGPVRAPAILKLFDIAPESRIRFLSSLQTAASISHPHLLEILDYGEGVVETESFVFLLAENTDANLVEVLADRALTPAETREMTEAATGALAHLHNANLVHGALEPARIYAVGQQIKILADSVLKPGVDHSLTFPADGYSAPELLGGTVLPAADIWSLGLITLECLTGQQPSASSVEQIENLPLPFRQIVRNSLNPNADERWNAEQIRLASSGGAEQAEPEPDAVPDPKANGSNRVRLSAGIGAAAVLVVFAGWQISRVSTKPQDAAAPIAAAVQATAPSSTPPNSTPASATAQSTPAPRTPSTPAQKEGTRNRATPTVVPEKPKAADRGNQFVIVATYNRLEDASKEAKSITARWPRFKADVQSPHHPNPPYLVTIGANLSKDAAARLQKEALRAGLPRDTYFQSF
jgi:serine/threonine protein kinase